MHDEQVDFRSILAQYREPSLRRTLTQLLTTFVPLIGLWALMYYMLDVSYWLVLALSIPTAGLMMRVFVLQHDCGHGSYFKSKLANDVVGMICSVITMTPYNCWRKLHAVHHATSGDLDRRGHGDIDTLTVDEYLRSSPMRRLGYRLYRNPLVLFGIGPVLHFVVLQRFNRGIPASWHKERLSTHITNVLLAATLVGFSMLFGFWNVVLVFFPAALMGAAIGVWLFYVQHQFEESYWQYNDKWEYFKAGIKGSSYYALPKVLQWFTANIGIHHLHHLDHLIPNYRLQECMDNHPELRAVNKLTIWQSLSCYRLKLWDERLGKMVTFRDAHTRLKELKTQAVTEEPAKTNMAV